MHQCTYEHPQGEGGGSKKRGTGVGVKVEKTSGKKLNKRGVKNSYMHFLLSLIIILV